MATADQSALSIQGKVHRDSDISDFAPELSEMFALHPTERAYMIATVRGTIPPYIRGSYYINGPAVFERRGLRYSHWLDGDGMVSSLRFTDDSIRFINRFVRTTKFKAEQEAGRPLYRAFGTAFAGDVLRRGVTLESPANVSIYAYAGTMLAFGEQALPWQLDPETLETVSQFDFQGSLTEISPFGAHPKFDPVSGEMFNFGISFSSRTPKLSLYLFDSAGNLRCRSNAPLDYPCAVHDFSMTAHYLVFYISPYLLDIDRVVRAGYSVMDSLKWRPELGSRLLVFSRDTGASVATIPLTAAYCLHHINSFEDGDKVVVDTIEFARPIYDQYMPLPYVFTDVPTGSPVRRTVDLHKACVISRSGLDCRLASDFPAIDPRLSARPYSEFWMLGISHTGRYGRKFFDQLIHARWGQNKPMDVFGAPPGCYLGGEPIFIRDPNSSENAAVICQLFDAQNRRSAFLLFDAFHVSAGPMVSLELEEPIPLAFHACFRPQS